MTNTILLVEDDPITQILFQVAIEKACLGVSIKTVDNGAQAKFYLEGIADKQGCSLPVAILTDVSMPGVSGIELLTWVKEHPELKNIPVIIMSGTDEPEQVKFAMDNGASSYFSKALPTNNLIYLLKSLSPWLPRNYLS